MAQLVFEIKNQWISRTDTFKPVAKSKNYLYAQFNFLTDEWVGVPTAIFRNKTSAYEQIIGQDGTCLVPWEVIDVEGDSEIFVSVFCGDLVTANKARVHVYDTGYGDDLESDTPPTPSVYEQILNRMDDIEEDMDDATRRAETAAENAEEASAHYPVILEDYWYVWDVTEREYVNTDIKAEGHDGTSATVEVEQVVGGHRIIITDVSGEHVFDVPDGHDGTDGRGIASLEKTSTSGDVDQYTMTFSDGSEPFVYYVTNGASATISTRAITNGYRLTITDKNGTRAIDVLNGAKGDPGNGIQSINKIGSYENYDYYEIRMTNGNKTSFTVTNGYSPTVSTVSLTGGHRVIITDANGSHSFDVMDGNGITNTVLNSDYTLTITFTDGTSYTTPSIRGAKGDTGNGIQSIAKTGTSGLVDTYTITYTNGQTTTFDVTNGETPTVDAGDVPYDDTETYSEGSVGDGLGSLKAEINQLQNDKADIIISNASGSIASFTDGADGLPMESVVAHIEPVQSGTGDPSPTNIRPISGWTQAKVTRTGKNILDVDKWGKALPFSQNGITWSKVRDGVYHAEGTATASAYFNVTYSSGLSNAMPCSALRGKNLYLSITNNDIVCILGYFKIDGTFTTMVNGSALPDEAVALRSYLKIETGTTINADFSIQLEIGSTATDYEPYQGETFTIDLDGTVYGGTVEAVKGKLTVTDANIVSYNGETLPSTWISDRDVYAEGTTPTTGAQVVYKLSTPIEYDLTPQEITSLLGVNNVFADTGDTDVTYRADTKLYLESHMPEIPVEDVQVNGTSIVNQGVANIPKGASGVLGVLMPYPAGGITVDSNGRITTNPPTADQIKEAIGGYRPIVPTSQHAATFYGLAKAASDTTQSASSNPVGTYTDAAKVAIQKMLGIYEPPFELLNDITLESESEIYLTADSNGTPYDLLGVYIYVYYTANLATASTGYGRYRVYDSNGNYCNAETGKYSTSTSAKFKHLLLDRKNNLAFLNYTNQQTVGGSGAWNIKSIQSSGMVNGLGNIVKIALASGDVEPAGTRIQIYGQRAY